MKSSLRKKLIQQIAQVERKRGRTLGMMMMARQKTNQNYTFGSVKGSRERKLSQRQTYFKEDNCETLQGIQASTYKCINNGEFVNKTKSQRRRTEDQPENKLDIVIQELDFYEASDALVIIRNILNMSPLTFSSKIRWPQAHTQINFQQ